MFLSRWSSIAIVGAGVAAAACGSPANSTPDTPPANAATSDKNVKPEYDKDGKLTRLAYDRDGDGKIDTWGFMAGSRVVRVEVDENHDGKVDRWEYHKDLPGAKTAAVGAAAPIVSGEGDPTLERIDRAMKYDGKISRREYFDNGALVKVEEDTDGDGKIDKWETYSNGTLAVMAIDTKGRGTPDRRLMYQPDGTIRIETDPSGTGTFRPLPH